MTVTEFVETRVQPEYRPIVAAIRGVAKHASKVRLKTLDDLNKPALRYYIKQAVKLDKS
jgi:hypothetical protein